MLALLLLACTPPPEVVSPDRFPYSDPAVAGAAGVGMRTDVFTDDRGKELTVEIWYPARVGESPPDAYEPLPITLDAHRDAPADRTWGARPLVAFSHGYGGIRYQSAFLTEHLASHGFVVVAVDHPDNTLLDLDRDATARVAAERPTDIARAVDYVQLLSNIPRHPLQGMVEGQTYGMLGHSFGAFTSLIVAGGDLDADAALAYCAEEDPAGCGFIEGLTPENLEQAVPDERAVASVMLAPGGWYAFGDHGLQGVRNGLVLGGDRDGDLPYNSEIRPTWQALPQGTPLLTLHDAEHWGFTDLCQLSSVLPGCSGLAGGWMETERVHAVTREAVTAWMAWHVAEDERFLPHLEPSAWEAEDVSWEP